MTKKQLNVDVNQLISGQLPPEENCPPGRVGVLVKARVIFRVGGATRQVSQRKIASWLGLGFGLELVLGLGGNFTQEQFS